MIKFYSPNGLRDTFSNIRVIVDRTECQIQKPKEPLKQQVTFSTYKNMNTVKVLVGMTPGGLVSCLPHMTLGIQLWLIRGSISGISLLQQEYT